MAILIDFSNPTCRVCGNEGLLLEVCDYCFQAIHKTCSRVAGVYMDGAVVVCLDDCKGVDL